MLIHPKAVIQILLERVATISYDDLKTPDDEIFET